MTNERFQIGSLSKHVSRPGAVPGPNSKISVQYPRHPSPGVRDRMSLDAESLRPIIDLNEIDLTLSGYAQDKSHALVYVAFKTTVPNESFTIYASDEVSFRCLKQLHGGANKRKSTR